MSTGSAFAWHMPPPYDDSAISLTGDAILTFDRAVRILSGNHLFKQDDQKKGGILVPNDATPH